MAVRGEWQHCSVAVRGKWQDCSVGSERGKWQDCSVAVRGVNGRTVVWAVMGEMAGL